jgi:hypothetical protein
MAGVGSPTADEGITGLRSIRVNFKTILVAHVDYHNRQFIDMST